MKAVFFDMDDTLYSRKVPFYEACGDFFGETLPFSKDIAFLRFAIRREESFYACNRGEISVEEMYQYRFGKAMEDVGVIVSDKDGLFFQRLYEQRQAQIHLSKEMEGLLGRLEKKKPLGLITNGPSEHQRKKAHALGLSRWIPQHRIYVSGDTGHTKPDPYMFFLAAQEMQCNPDDLLYVGDSFKSDICGAKAAGWKTLWLNLEEETETDADIRSDYEVRDEKTLIQFLDELQ